MGRNLGEMADLRLIIVLSLALIVTAQIFSRIVSPLATTRRVSPLPTTTSKHFCLNTKYIALCLGPVRRKNGRKDYQLQQAPVRTWPRGPPARQRYSRILCQDASSARICLRRHSWYRIGLCRCILLQVCHGRS
ncbi:hypothetical protein IV203_013272 [Nitzschia inconspicua]|uniref:Uncharacterized protein n=1 Tax=Nitzschia inconspicua TaxID=303405 RepID=A0A9K3M518_9STRA|nr:hypothetical protein IV203_013272 [Nitzschia inconspicua]